MSWITPSSHWLVGAIPFAAPAILWLSLGFAHFGGGRYFRGKIGETFNKSAVRHLRKAVKDELYSGPKEWIGGVRWYFSDGGFHRVFSFFDSSHLERYLLAPVSRVAYAVIAVVAALIATRISWVMHGSAPTNAPGEVAMVSALVLLIFGIPVAYDVLFECGVQFVLHPLVLDTKQVSMDRLKVHKQKAHGDAPVNSEDQTLSALARKPEKKSSAYDQEF